MSLLCIALLTGRQGTQSLNKVGGPSAERPMSRRFALYSHQCNTRAHGRQVRSELEWSRPPPNAVCSRTGTGSCLQLSPLRIPCFLFLPLGNPYAPSLVFLHLICLGLGDTGGREIEYVW